MALPMLLNGAECGPSNPLQDLTKRFDHDGGVQQDLSAGRTEHARQTFRTQQQSVPTFDQDAAKFFSAGSSHAPQISAVSSPYDLSTLHASLPASQSVLQGRIQHSPLAEWSADFLQHQPLPQQSTLQAPASQTYESATHFQQEPVPAVGAPAAIVGGMPVVGMQPWMVPTFHNMHTQAAQALHSQSDHLLWDKEFQSQENTLAALEPTHVAQKPEEVQQSARPAAGEADELARAANLVVEQLKDEQNPKFQKSEFMGLMRQLRDHEMVLDGNAIVERDLASSESRAAASASAKGKGKTVEITQQRQMDLGSAHQHRFQAPFTASPDGPMLEAVREGLDTHAKDETAHGESTRDENDVYFQRENEEYIRYWNQVDTSQAGSSSAWGELQDSWDQFEATTAGIKPIEIYQFQPNNPYLFGQSSRTKHHAVHSPELQSLKESVLELEAAVQHDPTDAIAWFELGVKQQENERERKAIQALQRAAELDPEHLPTLLALAISHVNDSNRAETYSTIKAWVDRNKKYEATVRAYFLQAGLEPELIGPRFDHLIQCLIAMARSNTTGAIDADVQIALAVTLNANEDYAKAQDCFRTALAVRPHDWLLYNRVGATLANSGESEEAIHFYRKALELNPGYIRARYNLGISCINLGRPEEAAQHILDALVLQESESVIHSTGPDYVRDISSDTLWDILRTASIKMERADLVALCSQQDVEGFITAFHEQSA